MLTELEVIDAVCKHLETQNYTITQRRGTSERGHDIIAHKGGARLIVEAKGETSSKPTTRRFGMRFDPAQFPINVADAFYCTVAAKEKHSDANYGIALANTREYKNAVRRIAGTLQLLHIRMFFVGQDKHVAEE